MALTEREVYTFIPTYRHNIIWIDMSPLFLGMARWVEAAPMFIKDMQLVGAAINTPTPETKTNCACHRSTDACSAFPAKSYNRQQGDRAVRRKQIHQEEEFGSEAYICSLYLKLYDSASIYTYINVHTYTYILMSTHML